MIPAAVFLTGLLIIRYNTIVNWGSMPTTTERRISHGSKEKYFNL